LAEKYNPQTPPIKQSIELKGYEKVNAAHIPALHNIALKPALDISLLNVRFGKFD
jgi:hypothetical protein